jgi:precorrin-2 dehydrogenase/sirohydrochlorin ferrochelatase
MLPIVLDLARVRVLLAGSGPSVVRRLALLDDAKPQYLAVFSPKSDTSLAAAAGPRLHRRLPTTDELARAQIVFLSGLEEALARDLAGVARGAGALVHMEDETLECDFHSPATLRRGDLVLSVSTNGRSPRLARRVRYFLERQFGPEWRDRLEEIAQLRTGWREGGADPGTVAEWTDAWIERQGLLEDHSTPSELSLAGVSG